jgi:indole-3-glycerol phosphate synthase
MVATYLDEILQRHRLRADADTRNWRERVGKVQYSGPSMFEALADRTNLQMKIIAEVKRRSPSRGWLNERLNVNELVHYYDNGGAAAISVLTDTEGFAGSESDLREATRAVSLPILRKDFTVSANDVLDTAEMGASTVLLIVKALNDEQLEEYLVLAETCGIDALVEVHDREEAKRAVDAGAKMIGVNQRNLATFDVDPEHAGSIINVIPEFILTVCESGLKSVDDVRRVADAGFDAVLVGEAFVTSELVEEKVRSFASSRWVGRG